jgi:hypothetical protein
MLIGPLNAFPWVLNGLIEGKNYNSTNTTRRKLKKKTRRNGSSHQKHLDFFTSYNHPIKKLPINKTNRKTKKLKPIKYSLGFFTSYFRFPTISRFEKITFNKRKKFSKGKHNRKIGC